MSCDGHDVVGLLLLLLGLAHAVDWFWSRPAPPRPPEIEAALHSARRRCASPPSTAWPGPPGASEARRALLPVTAYHEAAHVVLAYLHQPERTLLRVSIVGESPNPGCTEFAPAPAPMAKGAANERYWLSMAAVAMGGLYAELIVGTPAEVAVRRCGSDLNVAFGSINRLLRDGWRPSLLSRFRAPKTDTILGTAVAYKWTLRDLELHWCTVDALASALLERGTLDGAEATALVRRSLRRSRDSLVEEVLTSVLGAR